MKQDVAAMPDLIAIFEENAAGAAATVQRIASSAFNLRDAVERVVDGAAVIVLGPNEFLPSSLMPALRDIPGVIFQPTDQQLSTAGAGITAAFAGVASSGSVCIAMGSPLASAASLLMPLHIVLLDPARIVERPSSLFDPACLGGEALRRDMVLITGPSATADMGPLVRGVHGPHRLHILLLE
ncbi:MAG: LUD domain-containing protein [Candidatus Acidiferrum sp.]